MFGRREFAHFPLPEEQVATNRNVLTLRRVSRGAIGATALGLYTTLCLAGAEVQNVYTESGAAITTACVLVGGLSYAKSRFLNQSLHYRETAGLAQLDTHPIAAELESYAALFPEFNNRE